MNIKNNRKLIDHFKGFMSEQRYEQFLKILTNRTKHITVILEDLYQPHNASAVLRSCEIFGIQDVHIIENENKYEVNPDIALGSSKWLSLYRYNKTDKNNTKRCIETLKSRDYRIIATTPHRNDNEICDLAIDKPVALLFGTELTGLSTEILDMADGFVKIPMFGFTESFNISVSVALSLYEFTKRLHNSEINWKLADHDWETLMLTWMRSTIKSSELIEKRFLETGSNIENNSVE